MRKGLLGLFVFGVLAASHSQAQILSLVPAEEPRVEQPTNTGRPARSSLPERTFPSRELRDAHPISVAGDGTPAELAPTPSVLATPPTVLPDCEPVVKCRKCWARAETLLWWFKDSPVPAPLATTAPGAAPIVSGGIDNGSLGRADTTVVLGGGNVSYPLFFGGRVSFGTWLAPDQAFGIEAVGTFIPKQSTTQTVGSSGAITDVGLFNPFFDVNPATTGETSNILALAGIGPGSAATTLSSYLYSGELNSLYRLGRGTRGAAHLIAGFRYLNFSESLQLTTTQQGSLFGAPQFVNTLDQFKTHNNFYGGQLGLRLDHESARFFVQATAKIAYGLMNEQITIRGSTTGNSGRDFATLVPTTTVPGGIYALPTNIGSSSSDRTAFMPEGTLNVGLKFGSWGRAFVGYNFLYIDRVARPGPQIDRFINSTQLTSITGFPTGPLAGAARPTPLFNQSEFWAQGINLGFELRF